MPHTPYTSFIPHCIYTMYYVTKSMTVRDRNGEVLMKSDDQLRRWEEHFQETLNRPNPEEEASIVDTEFQVKMKRGPITQAEIKEAVRQTKGNRAPGEDKITADMLKVDSDIGAMAFEKLLCVSVWGRKRKFQRRGRRAS